MSNLPVSLMNRFSQQSLLFSNFYTDDLYLELRSHMKCESKNKLSLMFSACM